MFEVFLINSLLTFVKWSLILVFLPFITAWVIDLLFKTKLISKTLMKVFVAELVLILGLSFFGSANTPKYTLDSNVEFRVMPEGEIKDNSPTVLSEEERLEKLKGLIEENAQ